PKELQGGVRSEHADQYRISRGGGVRADGGFLAGDLAPDRIVDLSGEVAREAGNIDAGKPGEKLAHQWILGDADRLADLREHGEHQSLAHLLAQERRSGRRAAADQR